MSWAKMRHGMVDFMEGDSSFICGPGTSEVWVNSKICRTHSEVRLHKPDMRPDRREPRLWPQSACGRREPRSNRRKTTTTPCSGLTSAATKPLWPQWPHQRGQGGQEEARRRRLLCQRPQKGGLRAPVAAVATPVRPGRPGGSAAAAPALLRLQSEMKRRGFSLGARLAPNSTKIQR